MPVSPQPDFYASVGDVAWRGVNMRLDPAQLEPGFAAEAKNMRFSNGVPETRKGFVFPPWCNKITAGVISAWPSVHGVGLYSDPNTRYEYMIIAANGGVYQTVENNAATALSLPSGVTLTGQVRFTQAYDKMIMWRGRDLRPLIMNSIATGFEEITQTPNGDGTDIIPNAEQGVFFQNRLLIPHGDDEIAASDIGDVTRYSPTLADFKINQGTADKIVGLIKYSETSLVIFKKRSVYLVSNIYGSLSALKLDLITDQFGCVAQDTIVRVGSDIWFLSQNGVMSIRQTEFSKTQATIVPVSDPVTPIIETIDWNHASKAVAVYWNNRFYLSIPIVSELATRDTLVTSRTPSHSGTNTVVVETTTGATYYFTRNGSTNSLTNGTQTVSSDGVFTAQGSTVTINSSSSVVTAEVFAAFVGANTKTLVYDFLNQAWSGYDEAVGLEPYRWLVYPKQNKDRLFFMNIDGWICLHEEDYEDSRSDPYVDLTLTSAPSHGNTIAVNAGTTITATTASSSNTGTTWGVLDPLLPINSSFASQMLFGDYTGGVGGYSRSYSASPWGHSGFLTRLLISDVAVVNNLIYLGVRFMSTTSQLPSFSITGSWYTKTAVRTRQIEAMFLSRGYTYPNGEFLNGISMFVDIQTWNPSYSINLKGPGVAEETEIVADITKSRTAYYQPAHRTPWDSDNSNDDFLTPYREDYSVVLGTAGTTLGSGMTLGLHQESRHALSLFPTVGRTFQVEITNTQGRIRLMSAKATIDELRIGSGTHS